MNYSRGGTAKVNTIRVGVIGAGFMGLTHIRTLRRIRGVEVVALADVSSENAAKAAELLDVPQVFEDFEELITKSGADVIHNCTPNHLHYDVTKLALEAGKHVFSEKPLAITADQGEKLVQLAEERDLRHGVNFVYRYYPIIEYAKEIVEKGHLGKLQLMRGGYHQDWLAKDTDFNWRVKQDLGGPSRALADIGSHWCDLVQYVTGDRIIQVFADLDTVIPIRKRMEHTGQTFSKNLESDSIVQKEKVDTEDYAAVLFRTENGARGAFVVSQVSFGHKNQITLEISGDRCSMAWNSKQHERLWIGRRDMANQEVLKDPEHMGLGRGPGHIQMPTGHSEGWLDNFTNLLVDFYEDVSGDSDRSAGTKYPSFVDGLWEMYLVESMLASHRKQRWIPVLGKEVKLGHR